MMTSQDKLALSGLAHERAKKVMPGGNTRSSVYESPFPLYLTSGEGAYVTDVDENCYLDFQNNFTALIHGYGHGDVNAALTEQINKGLSFANPTESEIELAEIVCKRVPFFEQVRFTNTGSEAVMMAVKAARHHETTKGRQVRRRLSRQLRLCRSEFRSRSCRLANASRRGDGLQRGHTAVSLGRSGRHPIQRR